MNSELNPAILKQCQKIIEKIFYPQESGSFNLSDLQWKWRTDTSFQMTNRLTNKTQTLSIDDYFTGQNGLSMATLAYYSYFVLQEQGMANSDCKLFSKMLLISYLHSCFYGIKLDIPGISVFLGQIIINADYPKLERLVTAISKLTYQPNSSIKDSEPQIEYIFNQIKKATDQFEQSKNVFYSLWRSSTDAKTDQIYSAVETAIENIGKLSADNPQQVKSARNVYTPNNSFCG